MYGTIYLDSDEDPEEEDVDELEVDVSGLIL